MEGWYGGNSMKKRITQEESIKCVRRQLHVIVAVFTAVIVLGLTAFFNIYGSYNDRVLYQERLQQMQEVTGQLFEGIDNLVGEQWNDTVVLCNFVESEKPGTAGELRAYMSRQAQLYGLEELNGDIIAVDDAGRYYTQDGIQGALGGREYLRDRSEHVSFVSTSMVTNETKMFFLNRLDEPIELKNGRETNSIIYYGAARDMKHLNPYFKCSAYSGNNSVYVINWNGERLFSGNGTRLIQGNNAYSVLKKMDYLHGSSFDEAQNELREYGVAYSNAVMDGREYYYSLYNMKNADWLLLFLVPSDCVAIDTVELIGATVKLVLVFSFSLLTVFASAVFWILRVKQKQAIDSERRNNEALASVNEKLKVAAESAESANRAKSAFLSNMSHDIRTPMNAIVGLGTLMEREVDVSDKMRSYVHKIQLASNHLLGLINDILDMSRIESNEVRICDEPVCLSEQISQVDSIIRPQTFGRSQDFTIHAEGITHEYLICDGVRLRQIILNLLSNATKYTPEGGRISLSLEELSCDIPEHARFRITVTDNGYGMEPEFLEHIFEPFTRAEESVTNKIQGTGLGMAITKKIVDLMGGDIRVSSEPDKGSTFEITLDLMIDAQREKDRADSAASSGDNMANGSVLSGLRFLCAEDNVMNAEILKAILLAHGATGEICSNGEEIVKAFEQVKPGDFDAILMDVQMPHMNGLEAARAIRSGQNPLGRTIPILAMTANVFSDDIQNSIAAGMDSHISKPIDISYMERELRRVLNK